MPQRVRIYVPTDGLPRGSLLVLFGPGTNGLVDWSKPERGGVARAIAPGDDDGSPAAGVHNGPWGMGPDGAETRAMTLQTGEHVFGSLQFGVKVLERTTREVSGSAPGTVTAFVNSTPAPPNKFVPHAALDGGRCKFAIGGGVLNG